MASRNNVKVRYVDMSGSKGPANLAAVISDNTKLIMIESPTNPMQRIINIPDICRVAHSKNALVEVDSTMMTPCLQQPIKLGADLIVHSATKFISGHSDVMAGVVVAKNQELSEQVICGSGGDGRVFFFGSVREVVSIFLWYFDLPWYLLIACAANL